MARQKRAGQTVVTSVSITKEFSEIIEKYKISPTEALRKGIAIDLYERGLYQYQSNLNKRRFEFLEKIKKDMEIQKEFNEITELLTKFVMDAKYLSEIIKRDERRENEDENNLYNKEAENI